MGNLCGSNIVAPPLSARKVKQSRRREHGDDKASIFQSNYRLNSMCGGGADR
jgi:hypothetical protein